MKRTNNMQMLGVALFLGLAAAVFVIAIASVPASALAATLKVSPASQTHPTLMTNFDIIILQDADVSTRGAQADIAFNQAILEVMAVAKGTDYASGSLVAGNTIANANTTGLLNDWAVLVNPQVPAIPAGNNLQFLVITVRAKICGQSPISLSQLEVIDGNGGPVPVTGTNGTATGVSAVDLNPPPPATPNGVKDWTTPAGDNDCDGFSDTHETTLTTSPTQMCAATSGANNEALPDRWPWDFDDNQRANTIDILKFAAPGLLNSTPGAGSAYSPRFELRNPPNNIINTLDILTFSPILNMVCFR